MYCSGNAKKANFKINLLFHNGPIDFITSLTDDLFEMSFVKPAIKITITAVLTFAPLPDYRASL